MENTVSDAVIVFNNNTGDKINTVRRFPACLLDTKNYTPVKTVVATMFFFSCLYFLSGLYHFICWESGWFIFELLTKPLFLMFHIGVFSVMYCITWATFDLESFKACVLKFLGIVAAILYVCLPADLIPDFIPVIGQLDDLVAIVFGVYSAVTMGKPYVRAKAGEEKNKTAHPFDKE